MIQYLDRFALTNPLSGKKSSLIGLCGTLLLLGVCLTIYVPAVRSYLKGDYYQSQYMTYQNHTGYIYSKQDFKIALVIKDKLTGKPYNHTDILNTLSVQVQSSTVDGYFYQLLQPCDNNYFLGDINGVYLQDCMVIPNLIGIDVSFDFVNWVQLKVSIQTPYIDIPFAQYSTPKTQARVFYDNLAANSYIQFYFTSKVLNPSNQVKFQVHSFYTSQFFFSPTNLWSSFSINQGFKLTMIDDSIFPWRNNRNISTLNWNGEQRFVTKTNSQYSIFYDDSQIVAVRYYKKLDWLLGIIGGGIFFFFVIFWCIFNPINRWLQRIDLPSNLFLRQTNMQYPTSQYDLIPAKVSPMFILRNLWPFCKDRKTLRILSASEHQNDIVLLLKKLKVATRNLQKKEIITQFKAKFIVFPWDNINSLNRFLKGNSDNESYRSEQQSQVSSKSSNSKSSKKKSVVALQQRKPQIILDSRQPLDQQMSNRNEQNQHSGRKINSSNNQDNQSDRFQNINDGVISKQMLKQKRQRDNLPNQKIKQKQATKQKQEQFKPQIYNHQIQQKQQQMKKTPKGETKQIPILHIKEENQNKIVLQKMPLNRHLPSIIIVQNDQPLAIISSNQPVNPQPVLTMQESYGHLVQPLSQSIGYQKNQAGYLNESNHQLNFQNIPIEQISPQKRSDAAQNAEIREQPQHQDQLVFEQRQQVDQKFNLNSQQLLILRENKHLQQIFATNPTYWTFKQQKPSNFQEIMQMNKYDKYQGHFIRLKSKCRKMITDKIVSFFKWLDVFWVRINFQERESGSFFGIFLTFLVISASIVTFALTINNMKNYQYIIDKDYVQPKDIYFTGYTSDSLNIVVCPNDNSNFYGSQQIFSLKYFVNVSGNVTYITPLQMTWNDNTFNLYGNKLWDQYTSYCFKMPSNIPISLNSTSYFGYTISTYCPGTAVACNISRSKFVSQSSSTFINTYMPSNTIDFNSSSLISSVSSKISSTVSNIQFTLNSVYQETILAEIVELKDDSGNQFMGSPSKLFDSNLNVGPESSKQIIIGSNSSAPSYTFNLKPSQSKTVYILSQRKLSFILGIIGGVFVIWYAIFNNLTFLYNKFHFHMFVAKQIYEEQGYDGFVLSKLLASLKVPPYLLPNCCDVRNDIQRMQGVSTKIEKSLYLPSLIKYVDNVYRLSSSFFDTIPLKHLSLLHFKQKIDQASKLVQIVKVKQNQEPEFMSVYDQIQDKQKQKSLAGRQVANQTKISFFQNWENTYNKQIQGAVQQAESVTEIERQNQNIIQDSKPCYSSIFDYFDMFQEPASLTFNHSRKIQSCFGGLLTLIMIFLVVIVVIQPVTNYLTSAGRIVSYQTKIDQDMSSSNGLTLTTGTNFKLGVSALNATSLLPANISSYIKSTVGISLLVKTTNKTNGLLTEAQTTIDLIPCPLNYLSSSLSPTTSPPSDNFKNAYCVPDGVILEISGVATDLIHKYFKVSIYDKSNTATGYKNMVYLLGNYTFQIHYSSPQRNYVDQSMRYFVWSTILDMPGKTHIALATQRNMTLSKVNITYKGDSNHWQEDSLAQISYIYDDFLTERLNFAYVLNSSTNMWYNVSFAYNKKVYLYSVTTPKFYQIWGLVGGVVAFFFFIANCLGSSFNKYKMRYLIGRQLYNFDKLKDGSMKIKRKKIDKQMFHKINNYGESKILLSFFLSGIARIINDYHFNDTLRRITLIQNKVKSDLDIIDFYRKLYIARESISKQLQKKHHIFRRIKPTDLYLKQIYNPYPIEYNYTELINYAKQNNLSSFEQKAILAAKKAKVNIREVFDGKLLAKTFGLQDDNRTARLNDMRETIGSFNSSSGGGDFGPSIGEPSVNLE